MPLRRTDVDTDQIIPTRFVPYFSRTGFTNALFADWRDDPAFVLNLPEYGGATILVAGNDFGTGSSRESAVWALQAAGFRVVIAPALRRHLPRQRAGEGPARRSSCRPPPSSGCGS